MASVSLSKYYRNARGFRNYDVEICITMLVIVELWATIAIPSLSALHNVSIESKIILQNSALGGLSEVALNKFFPPHDEHCNNSHS